MMVIEKIVHKNEILSSDCDTWSGYKVDLAAVFERTEMCFSALKMSRFYLMY